MKKKQSPTTKGRVHFIGIGGIGISALARWFLSEGYKVSGSDARSSELTKELIVDGITVKIGHNASNLPSKDVSLVVYSAAVKSDNPEREKAEKLGFKTQLYAEALGEVSKNYKTIAVAGAHGKSTTTSLLSLILVAAKFDPTVIVGTKLKEFNNSNFRKGKSDYLVVESDEYNRSFLNYSPAYGIITNIDREHLDIYKDLNDIKNNFLKYIKGFKNGATLVLNADNKNLLSIKSKIEKIAESKNIKLVWYSIEDKKYLTLTKKIKEIIKIPGNHNLSNSLAAVLLAKSIGVKDENKILKSVSSFRGAWRRMEYKGEIKIPGIRTVVYDDYAHHPTEIKATLSGLRDFYPNNYIVCVFEPHQAQRLKNLFDEFSESFDFADNLILLDIYKVKGRDEAPQPVNSQKLAFKVGSRIGIKNSYLKQVNFISSSSRVNAELKKKIFASIKESKNKNAIVVMMGAGDIYKMTKFMLK